MPAKHRIPALAVAILLLLAFGVSRLQAQSPITLEGLSNRITTLVRTGRPLAPTPGPAFAAATRLVNIRTGPGTNYPVLASAEYCDITVADASAMIDRHGQRLDDAGWSAAQEVRARATLMLMLSTFKEADRTQAGCDAWLTGTINAQLGAP